MTFSEFPGEVLSKILHFLCFNPIALRQAKTAYNFGLLSATGLNTSEFSHGPNQGEVSQLWRQFLPHSPSRLTP